MTNTHEANYHVQDTENTQNFHQSRRMFCIKNGKVFLAPVQVPYSHVVWFTHEGWITSENDDFMRTHVRGFVSKEGDLYFYVGYDFVVTPEVEKIFFDHLSELVKMLHLKPEAKIYGGLIKQPVAGDWPPRKTYGTMALFLNLP